ncbi:MAG TPA: discoidin domain-containing protein, partial [Acidimicrobiales bacterium]|nr:discoidin domain-containing protein [Acidimicrobiales bacterium]
LVPDDMIDRLVGRPGSDFDGLVAYSEGRLPGDLRAGAISTLGGNPGDIWEPGFGSTHQAGQWLQYDLGQPVSFDHLDLQIVADGQHSVPTEITVSTDSGSATVALPPVADSPVPGSIVDTPVSFPMLTGQSIRITVDQVRLENTPNYYSRSPIAMPIGIAAVGIPGVSAPPVPADIPATCRDDLLSVDGNPLWVEVTGSTSAALDRQALTVSLCGPDAGGLTLGPGQHVVESVAGHTTGFDIDQLALDSAPGGGPMALAAPGTLAAPSVTSGPVVHATGVSTTSMGITISGVPPGAAPFDLVLGESIDRGWKASVVGGPSLGTPFLVDGFANGWRIDPAALGRGLHDGTLSVVLTWTPQARVDVALVVSLAAILGCLVLAVAPRRRAAGPPAADAEASAGSTATRPTVPATPESEPRLAVPFGAEAVRARWWVALAAGVVVGVLGAAISTPLTGVAAGAATALALMIPRLRSLLGLVAVAGVVAAGAYTAAHQAAVHAPTNGSWPQYFGTASTLAWVGVVFLGAEAVVGVLLERRRRPSGSSTPAPTPTPPQMAVGDGSGDGHTPLVPARTGAGEPTSPDPADPATLSRPTRR